VLPSRAAQIVSVEVLVVLNHPEKLNELVKFGPSVLIKSSLPSKLKTLASSTATFGCVSGIS